MELNSGLGRVTVLEERGIRVLFRTQLVLIRGTRLCLLFLPFHFFGGESFSGNTDHFLALEG